MTPDTQSLPAATARVLLRNIEACRRQNKLRAEGKLPVYRHEDIRPGGAHRKRRRS